MAVAVPSREEGAVVWSPVTAAEAAALGADDVLARLGSGTPGLPEDEAARRLRVVGPNAVRSHRVHALAGLGVTVKVLTGDNPVMAARVCAGLGLPPGQVATGADIDAAGDRLGDLLARTAVFARVSPEHRARIVRAQRRTGAGVAFLGDGVNDAIALHAADVASRSTRPPTWPRTRPTCCCWTRTWTCWPTA